MNYTENFNLKKPQEDDQYNIEDANNNADIIDEELCKINETIGDKNELPTEDKTNLVNAIKEVFTSGNEKKQQLVTNLIAKGVTCSIDESWESLLAKVLTIFTGADVSCVTATASDVLDGIVFVDSSGNEQIGTMPDMRKVNQSIGAISSYFPNVGVHDGLSAQVRTPIVDNVQRLCLSPPTGYYEQNNSYVGIKITDLPPLLGITPDKIVKNKIICGVLGTGGSTIKFASGIINNFDWRTQKSFNEVYGESSGGARNCSYFTVTCDFVPFLIFFDSKYSNVSGTSTILYNGYVFNPTSGDRKNGYTSGNNSYYVTTIGQSTDVIFHASGSVGVPVDITWYAVGY